MNEDRTLRYLRQINLKEIGIEGQEKLLKAKVLVIGAGGLGSTVLYYLAAAGVGSIGIVDYDIVDMSNLQRQILYSTENLQAKKVDVAKEKLEKLNPDVSIKKYAIKINIDNIEQIVDDYDVVIDATDNFFARYLISDCCYLRKKPLVEGAVQGFLGILTTIIPGKSPCYRCLHPIPPKESNNHTNTGILGVTAGTIGTLQALEAVKIILGIGELLLGRVLIFEGLDLSFREIKLENSKGCQLCGENSSIKELKTI